MITRDFTATAYVVWQGRTLLHKHKKLNMWLPCGGHIDPNELPDEAAIREVLEESGVAIELVGDYALDVTAPRQLLRPRGIQLEQISADHEHIDLMYLARPVAAYNGYLLETDPTLGWYDPSALAQLELSDEVRAWTDLAFRELG